MHECSKNGIYTIKCTDCDKQYLGQTERSFRTRFKEYEQQNQNSKFSVHLQVCRHSIGRIDEIMEVVQDVSKGTFMNVL